MENKRICNDDTLFDLIYSFHVHDKAMFVFAVTVFFYLVISMSNLSLHVRNNHAIILKTIYVLLVASLTCLWPCF